MRFPLPQISTALDSEAKVRADLGRPHPAMRPGRSIPVVGGGTLTVRREQAHTWDGAYVEYSDGRDWDDDEHEECAFRLDGTGAKALVVDLRPMGTRLLALSDFEAAVLSALVKRAAKETPPGDPLRWLAVTVSAQIAEQARLA